MPKKMKKKKVKSVKRKSAARKKTSKSKHIVTHSLPRPALAAVPRPALAASAVKALRSKAPKGTKLGEVEDYFSHIGVIALTLKDSVALGDTIRVQGHTTNFLQRVDSMQIDHEPVKSSKKGDSVGIKVYEKCRKGDDVFRI